MVVREYAQGTWEVERPRGAARVGGKPLTDSDRYRLVGYAWSVPVAAWILERLLARMVRDAAEGR